MSEKLYLSMFGSFQAVVDGEPATGFESDKARALLAYLVIEAATPHRRESLTALFWPDLGPNAARHNLSQALFSIRQALKESGGAESILLANRRQVQLNPDSRVESDASQFETLLASCRIHVHERPLLCAHCMAQREQAVSLYRGDFLGGLSVDASAGYDDWVALHRERWHRQAVEALFMLAQFHEWRGELAVAGEYARRQVTLEPWREEAHRQLMRLLAHSGQRSTALAQYEICRKILRDELGVTPTAETQALYTRIRDADTSKAHNLPEQPTPFIGREAELAHIAQQLAQPDCRVLTVAGIGGVGKTRLALEVGRQIKARFLDGVWYIPMVGMETADLLLPAIAETLTFTFSNDTDQQGQLISYLHYKEMLLILDNFEHVPEAASLVAHIARQAAGVKFLLTSRMRLNLTWDWTYELDGLDQPPEALPDAVAASGAGQLLLHTIRRDQHDFDPTPADLVAIRRICALVDGLPLALELAGAWARALSCSEIAAEIEQSLSFLSASSPDVPPRHRSVQAVIAHTWGTLALEEQGVFNRLSIFRGAFTREAARVVAGAGPAAMARLVDRSLIRRTAAGDYELHELLRQYGREKLAGLGDIEQETVQRHATYFAAQLDNCARRLPDTSPEIAFHDLRRQFDNIRAAWQWVVAGQQIGIIRQMVDGLFWYCEWRGRYMEGRELLQSAVAQITPDGQPKPVWEAALLVRYGRFCTRLSDYEISNAAFTAAAAVLESGDNLSELALLLDSWGTLKHQMGDYKNARSQLEQSVTIYRELNDLAGLARSLNHLGSAVHRLGDYELARGYATESLQQFRRLNHRPGIAATLHSLAYVAYELGEYKSAEQYYTDSIAIRQEINDRWGLASAYNNLGIIYYDMGDYTHAEQYYQQCMHIRRELGDTRGIAVTLNNLGLIAAENGNYHQAEIIYQESLDLCRQIGNQQGVSIALNNLGEVASLQNDFEQARDFHQKSLVVAREIGYRRSITFALEYLGWVSLKLARLDEAGAYYAEALQLAWESNALPRVLNTLYGMALLALEREEAAPAARLLQIVTAHPAAEQATRDEASRTLADLPVELISKDEKAAENSLAAVVDSLLTDS